MSLLARSQSVAWALVLSGGLGGAALAACGDAFTSSGSGGSGGVTTSTTTTSTTTSTGGQGQGGGGQGGSGSGEDCTNGSDDDSDLLADCADPDCTSSTSGYACVQVPPGWAGPILASAVVGPPTCPAPWNPQPEAVGGTSVTGAPLGCGCTCTAQSILDCGGNVTVALFDQADCGGGKTDAMLTPGACMSMGNGMTVAAGSVDPPQRTGECAPNPAVVQNTPPVVAHNQVAVCAGVPLGTGCDLGACTPTGGPDGPTCFAQVGNVACPPGAFDRQVIFTSATDTRGCACACSVSGDCAASATVYSGAQNCQGTATSVPGTGDCTPLAGNSSIVSVLASLTTPTCQPAPSTTGGVVGANPVTLCCLPPVGL
ncbi:MAG: hypothetical protein HY908_29840 [Myxococcales bacterium]|nr:hypothetical protein [Myxococcales bacterium]